MFFRLAFWPLDKRDMGSGAGAEEAEDARKLVGGPIFSTRSQPSIHEEEDRRPAGLTWDSEPAAQFRPGVTGETKRAHSR